MPTRILPDVMIDLETFDNKPTSAILTIGAVFFDRATGALGKEFSCHVELTSCLEAGLTVSDDTMNWWADQNLEALEGIIPCFTFMSDTEAVHIDHALQQLGEFVAHGGADVRPWGCGSDFDISILSNAYHAAGKPVPWKFWNSRCLRTLRDLHPGVKISRSAGSHHNALDDARNQAAQAVEIFRQLRARSNEQMAVSP